LFFNGLELGREFLNFLILCLEFVFELLAVDFDVPEFFQFFFVSLNFGVLLVDGLLFGSQGFLQLCGLLPELAIEFGQFLNFLGVIFGALELFIEFFYFLGEFVNSESWLSYLVFFDLMILLLLSIYSLSCLFFLSSA
jgi:hypothetical protein